MITREEIRFTRAIAQSIALQLKLSPPLTLPHDILTISRYVLLSIFLMYMGLMTILSGIKDHVFNNYPVDISSVIAQIFSIGIILLGFYSLTYCCRRLYITIVCRQYFDHILRYGTLVEGEVKTKELVQGRWRIQYSLDHRQDRQWVDLSSNNTLSVGDKVTVAYFNDLLNFTVG